MDTDNRLWERGSVNLQERAQAGGPHAEPEVLVGLGNHILATDVRNNTGGWDCPNSHNSEGGKEKGRAGGVCVCMQLLSVGRGWRTIRCFMAILETELCVFLYREPQGA